MDLSALQAFVEVIRRGSFAAVARDRGTAPSSISRTIAALERELSVRLFQRSTRKLVLTAAGQRFFARIGPLVDELEAAASMAADETEQVTGRLRITAPVTFGQVALVPLLPEFARLHAALSFDLLLTDATIDLAADRVDVALRLGTPDDSSLVATRLFAMRYVVCASPICCTIALASSRATRTSPRSRYEAIAHSESSAIRNRAASSARSLVWSSIIQLASSLPQRRAPRPP